MNQKLEDARTALTERSHQCEKTWKDFAEGYTDTDRVDVHSAVDAYHQACANFYQALTSNKSD